MSSGIPHSWLIVLSTIVIPTKEESLREALDDEVDA